MKQTPSAKSVKIRKCSARRVQGQVEIEFTISNQSERPAFVVNSVRRIQLDESTGALHVWFYDPGPAPAAEPRVRKEYSVPETRAVEPGREASLKARLPEVMTRPVVQEDGSVTWEALDLTKADHVEIHVAFDDKPIYFRVAPKEARAAAPPWGTTITATVELPSPPGRDKSARQAEP
jgi:hypothetical protein